MSLHEEVNLEIEICQHLAAHDRLYAEGDAANYDDHSRNEDLLISAYSAASGRQAHLNGSATTPITCEL